VENIAGRAQGEERARASAPGWTSLVGFTAASRAALAGLGDAGAVV